MDAIVPVSVVVPCYRCAQTIERAVASVAAQTALPMELILVEDGSGDCTLALLGQLCNQYAPGWIKLVVMEKNEGAATARNAGWDKAVGNYVAFLDADDSWHPLKIKLQYEFMLSNSSVMVCGHGHNQVKGNPKTLLLDRPVFRNLSIPYVLLKNPFITPSFMVRRDLPIRFLQGRRHMEDHLFLMRVATSGMRIAKSRLPLAFIYKNIYGETGLSADLWIMQQSELENYDILGNDGYISPAMSVLLRTYSWVKFFRRFLIVKARKLSRIFFKSRLIS